ncbi:MAG: TRAP transporter small permease subunit, partial [Alphaproteobacteria bacterium]
GAGRARPVVCRPWGTGIPARGGEDQLAEASQTPDFLPKGTVERAIVSIGKVLSLGYALSIAVTIYDVACDKLATPTIWVYDVVTTAIAVSFLVGGSWALQRREHIQITALFDRYPERRKRMFDAIGYAGSLVYLFVVMWF